MASKKTIPLYTFSQFNFRRFYFSTGLSEVIDPEETQVFKLTLNMFMINNYQRSLLFLCLLQVHHKDTGIGSMFSLSLKETKRKQGLAIIHPLKSKLVHIKQLLFFFHFFRYLHTGFSTT